MYLKFGLCFLIGLICYNAVPIGSCPSFARVKEPLSKTNTTLRLQALREQIKEAGLDAYIVPSGDDHQSEYVPEHDKRRAFISGFTGSVADAVITLTSAALWVDSRYYIQAEEQLDANWQLMKIGLPGVPTIEEWLSSVLQNGNKVGGDPKLLTYTQWISYENVLASSGIEMAFQTENLIDKIWNETNGRPPFPSEPIVVMEEKYTGRSWQDKLQSVRNLFKQYDEYVVVFAELDDIAWFLNMRGNDVSYTPVFRAFVFVTSKDATVYLPPEKITNEILTHLNANSSVNPNGLRVMVRNYTDVLTDYDLLMQRIKQTKEGKVILSSPYSYQKGTSYLFYRKAPSDRVIFMPSAILGMKDHKNEVEDAGMRRAHIRDAIAFCQLIYTLEKEVPAGKHWDELSAASLIEGFRTKQILTRGSSYGAISAFGSNAALPHYSPTPETNKVIDTSGVYLLDSGGQYLDGTTDVTRSFHFGTPTQEMIDIYTELLMGCIDMVTVVFPRGQTVYNLEILIRRPLFRSGLNYGHGSGHGIGAYLSVHESFNQTYHEGYFGSNEPGYYRENEFGFRLENAVTVIKTNISQTPDVDYLTFEPVTFIPYEKNLINPKIMDKRQLDWLNDYHMKVRNIVGEEMKKQGLNDEYNWLLTKTEPITV